MDRIDRQELIERSGRFWRREQTDRPLVGALFNRLAPLTHFTEFHPEPRVRLEDLSIQEFIADCDRRHEASEQIEGDAIFVANPFIGFPWMEAILGCTIECGGGSAWPKLLDSDWKQYSVDSVPWSNGWFDRMQEQTKAALAAAGGRYPVGPVHLRGMGDVIANLMGQTEFCLALYDYPDMVRSIIDIYVEVWRKITRSQYELLGEEAGGYWNGNQPLWAPGKTMFIPADVASLISPRMFEDFLLTPTQRMLEGYDYCIMHTHSAYLDAYPLDLLMNIEQLKAVQIGLDPNGPSVQDLLPQFRRVLERRALIVGEAANYSVEDINFLIKQLPAEGLCILIYRETVEECREVLKAVGHTI
jgi:hypothetical protein